MEKTRISASTGLCRPALLLRLRVALDVLVLLIVELRPEFQRCTSGAEDMSAVWYRCGPFALLCRDSIREDTTAAIEAMPAIVARSTRDIGRCVCAFARENH